MLTSPSDSVSSFKCFNFAFSKDVVTEILCDSQKIGPYFTLIQALEVNHFVLGGRKRKNKAFPGWKIASNTLPWKIVGGVPLTMTCRTEKIFVLSMLIGKLDNIS